MALDHGHNGSPRKPELSARKSTEWWIACCAVVFGFATLWTSSVHAQTVRDVERVLIDQSTIIKEYTPPPKRGSVQLTLEDIKERISAEQAMNERFVLQAVALEGASMIPLTEFTPLWVDRVGKTISLADIFQITRQIESVYRQAGYLVIAAVPDQDYQTGRIRIVVFEQSYFRTVKFDSKQPELEKRLEPYISRLVNMQPLRLPEIERTLLLMSDLAGISLEATLTRPEVAGEGGTLTFEVGFDRRRGMVAIDNRGNDEVGPVQLSGQLAINDLFRQFDANTLTAVTIPSDPRELALIQLAQEFPIGSRGFRLGYNAGYVRSKPGGNLRAINVEVETVFSSFYGSYAFLRTIDNSVYGTIGLSTNDTQVDVMGSPQARDDYRWLEFGLSSEHGRGPLNANLSVTFLQGLDVLNASSRGAGFVSRNDAAPDFRAVQSSADLSYGFSGRVSLQAQAVAQFASDPLPNTMQFSFGGDPFGRAFDSSAISGDSGFAASLTLNVRDIVKHQAIVGSSGFVFVGYGSVWNRGNDFDYSQASLSSTGIGINARLKSKISLQATLAAPIKSMAGVTKTGLRLFFAVSKSF